MPHGQSRPGTRQNLLMIRIPQLKAEPLADFPPVEMALEHPNGLLCAGGDLSIERLLRAYRRGIFPWFNAGEPILWWSPDPRCVFELAGLRPSRSLRRFALASGWRITADCDFEAVITACAAPRDAGTGTWIDARMHAAYLAMHRHGHAHSVEVWDGQHLIGGIYGIAIGHVFFGESMFSQRSGGSKVALFALARQLFEWGFVMIDGQVRNPHLISLGAGEVQRSRFLRLLDQHCNVPDRAGSWSQDWSIASALQLGQGQSNAQIEV